MDYLVTGRRRAYAGLTAMALGAVALVGGLSGTAGATDEEPPDPRHVDGNPTCAQVLEGSIELLKIENPTDGTYPENPEPGDFTVTIDVDLSGEVALVSFSNASQPVNVVIVKAGPGANVYDFDPGVTEADDLESPKDSISHISFCGTEDNGTTTTTTTTPDEEPTTTTTTTPDDEETTTTTAPDDEETTTTMGVSPTTDDDGGLPVTGSNTGLMVAVGALLLVGGGTLLATSRLRRARGEA